MGSKTAKSFRKIVLKPVTGTILAVMSGLSFFLLSMMLPLVGPSGSRVAHAGENKAAFVSVLLLTFTLAALASWSKLEQRKLNGGPLPWFSLGLGGVCVLTLVVLLVGGFAI